MGQAVRPGAAIAALLTVGRLLGGAKELPSADTPLVVRGDRVLRSRWLARSDEPRPLVAVVGRTVTRAPRPSCHPIATSDLWWPEPDRGHAWPMALAQRSTGPRREWFNDARDSGRRMEVSWHRDEQIVIVSLWQGSLCRATFRMPIADAPDAIRVLADALGDAASGPLSRPVPSGSAPAGVPLPAVIDRLRRWLGHQRAKVIELRPPHERG